MLQTQQEKHNKILILKYFPKSCRSHLLYEYAPLPDNKQSRPQQLHINGSEIASNAKASSCFIPRNTRNSTRLSCVTYTLRYRITDSLLDDIP